MRIVTVSLSLLAATSGVAWSEASPELAAKAWLSEIDGGLYTQAWSEADPLIQGATSRTDFSQGVGRVRRPLGPEVERTLAGSTAASSLPGAPDGAYVVLTYRTHFAQKAQATETLVMRKEADGWKASGYYVR